MTEKKKFTKGIRPDTWKPSTEAAFGADLPGFRHPELDGTLSDNPMVNAGLFTLGWIMAKHGIEAEPVPMLARALKEAGAESSHVDGILHHLGDKFCDHNRSMGRACPECKRGFR